MCTRLVNFDFAALLTSLSMNFSVQTFEKGGIETLSITEAFGEFRLEHSTYPVLDIFDSCSILEEVYSNDGNLCFSSGKTQLAHTLCVSTQVYFYSWSCHVRC